MLSREGGKWRSGAGIAGVARLMEMEWRAERTTGEGYELILLAEGKKAAQFV